MDCSPLDGASYASQIKITKLEDKLRLAIAALQEIANEDFGGPQSIRVTKALLAIKRINAVGSGDDV